MRLIGFPLLVASSLLWVAAATADTRPHYGGTLLVEMQAAPTSIDPADSNRTDWFGSRNLFNLLFDTLVSLNDQGKPEPALASSWQAEAGNQRWHFLVRRGVTFQDGTVVTPDAVATSLRRTNPTWKVFAEGEEVVIERDSPAPNLPEELSLPRNSIVKRDSGKVAGTGPFAVSRWEPGKRISLATRDDYWGGRGFLDAIEIEMGKSFRDQAISFDLGKAQVIEIAPEQAHRAASEGHHVETSAPVELIALLFSRVGASAHLVARMQPLRAFQIVYLVMVLVLGAALGEYVLQRSAWRWTAAILLLAGIMFGVARSAFPNSSHLSLPWIAPRNPWAQAFLWVRQYTPKDAASPGGPSENRPG